MACVLLPAEKITIRSDFFQPIDDPTITQTDGVNLIVE